MEDVRKDKLNLKTLPKEQSYGHNSQEKNYSVKTCDELYETNYYTHTHEK